MAIAYDVSLVVSGLFLLVSCNQSLVTIRDVVRMEGKMAD